MEISREKAVQELCKNLGELITALYNEALIFIQLLADASSTEELLTQKQTTLEKIDPQSQNSRFWENEFQLFEELFKILGSEVNVYAELFLARLTQPFEYN